MPSDPDRDQAIARIKEQIEADEGLRLDAYLDSLGYPTIGYGHKLGPRSITAERAHSYLDQDFQIAEAGAISICQSHSISITGPRFYVLVEMVFQLGVRRTQKFERMLTALKEQDYDQATVEMIDSLWHKETPKRVERLAQVMKDGQPR